jgi:hypothetical protein
MPFYMYLFTLYIYGRVKNVSKLRKFKPTINIYRLLVGARRNETKT